jgi:hypothetical protein
MTPTLRRVVFPLIAVACYVTSFFLPALYLTGKDHTAGQQTNMLGIMAFINGLFALFELQCAWLANPLAGLALMLLLVRAHVVSLVLSLAALVVAQHTWVLVGTTIIGDEGGVTKYLVNSLGPGFYLWCGSFLLLAVASLVSRSAEQSKHNAKQAIVLADEKVT